MKPNKNNRIMCPDCGRPKMYFETEKKARNFIRYNGEELLRENQTIDDLRAYYCPSCMGWHITSKPFRHSYTHNTDNLIRRYHKNIETPQERALRDTREIMIPMIEMYVKEQNVPTYKQLKKRLLNEYYKNNSALLTEQQKQAINTHFKRYFKETQQNTTE